MRIPTARFGEIDIDEEKLLHFPYGLPPFEDSVSYALINTEETDPFLWLQSTTDPDIALAVVNPFRLFPDYRPSVTEDMLLSIDNPADENILVLVVSVIPQDFQRMTANLVSPILINAATNKGRQIIMENSPYQIRQPIFDEVRTLLTGGGGDADTNA